MVRPTDSLTYEEMFTTMFTAPSLHERVVPAGGETRAEHQYANAFNPHTTRLLKLLQMNVRYARCRGTELFTAEGWRILDFLSGYCVHNLGHNHSAIIAALKDELDRSGACCA